MTYNARKILTGQEVVEAVKIYADGCKYSTPAMLAARAMVTSGGSSLSAGATGDVLTLTVGDASLFGTEVWIRMPSGEVLKADVDTATQVTVTARGLFGTTPAADSGSMICRMMHEGEADGSCSGLAQSCSADTAYDGTTLRTLQFSYAPLPAGTVYSNGLRRGSVSRDGPEVHPGRDIGTRARLTFTLDDELDEADEFNPYRDRVATGGTKLGKLLARNPYFETRKCEFLEGLRDAGTYDEPEWVTRGYVIDKVEFSKGQARFTCLDPLILAEDRKSKTPPQSTGKLSGAIAGTPSTFSYTDADNYAYGPNASTTWVRIDSEIIKCTVTGATTLTVVTRGYKSETKDHEDGALIQLCDVFINEHMVDAIEWILTNRTTTPAAYIGSYAALVSALPDAVITEAILSKPLDSTQRINELIRLADLTFYFDEIDQEIVIEHYPEMSIEPVSLNDDDHFGKESIDIQRNADQQFTRFTYAWAPYDVTKDSEEYYQFFHTAINATLEGPRYIGAPNEKPLEKTVFLTDDPDDAVLAVSYVSRTLDRLTELPSILTAELDAETVGDTQGGLVAPGKIISVSTASDQTKTGDQVGGLYQIERISGTLAKGFKLKARRYVSVAPDTVDFTIDAGTYTDYDLSDHYAPSTGNYTVYISPGAIFGASSTATFGFTTGTQAGGVSFHFIHRGQWLGTGGAGGDGANVTLASTDYSGYKSESGTAGQDGGGAFEATVDCTIDTGSGLIWAGGGGAGGMSTTAFYDGVPAFYSAYAGNGGGGGRGFATSAGGAAGNANDGTFNADGTVGADGGLSSATGGDWGEDGPLATTNPFHEHGRAAGGAAGPAITKNGNTVTITAGNNPTNIKGAIV